MNDLDFYDLMANKDKYFGDYDEKYNSIKTHEELRLFAYESWMLSGCKDNFNDSLTMCTSSHPSYDPDSNTCDFTS